MSKKLKPCPFCGAAMPVVQSWCGGLCYSVICRECYVETNDFDEKDEAIAAWNTRAGEHE